MTANAPAPKDINHDLIVLAQEIDPYDTALANRLRFVAGDVGGLSAGRWLGMPVDAIFGFDSLERKIRQKMLGEKGLRGRLYSFVEWARNVGVLLPVLFTWYGISQITKNFSFASQFISDLRFDSFLINGFNGLDIPGAPTQYMTLGVIASWDAILIAGLIALTAIISIRRDIIERNAANKALELRSRAEELLWQAPLTAPIQPHAPIEEQFTAAVNLLVSMQQNSNQTMAMLQATLDQVKDATQSLQVAIGGLPVMFQQYQASLASMKTEVLTMGQQFQTAAAQLKDTSTIISTDLQKIGPQINQEIGSLSTTLSPLSQLNGLLSQLQSVNQALSGVATSMHSDLTGIVQSMDSLKDGLHTDLEASTTAINSAGNSIQPIISAQGQQAIKLDGIVHNMAAALQKSETTLDTTNRGLAQFLNSLDIFVNRAGQAIQSSTNTGNAPLGFGFYFTQIIIIGGIAAVIFLLAR